MKTITAMMFICVLAADASAQSGGSLALFSDESASSCQLSSPEDGLLEVFVIHEGATAVSGSTFRVSVPYCALDIWGLGGTTLQGTSSGTAQSGVEVQYGECLASPVVVMKVVFLLSGDIAPCCPLIVEESVNPEHEGLSATGCSPGFDVLAVTTQPGFMNPNAACACAVHAETTTWGKVKALYH